MTVHAIKVVAATGGTETPGLSLGEINTALDDWVSKASEWEEQSDEHSIRVAGDGLADPNGPTEYFRGSYRFEIADAKSNLIQKLEDKLKKKVDWYRIAYHVCDHDVDDRSEDGLGNCSWDLEVEYTAKNIDSIPGDVPSFVE